MLIEWNFKDYPILTFFIITVIPIAFILIGYHLL